MDRRDEGSDNTVMSLPSWRQLHPGEDPRIEAMQFARFGTAPDWEKMKIFRGLNRGARRLALIGLRERYPQASEAALRRRLASVLLGDELAERVYGPIPANQAA